MTRTARFHYPSTPHPKLRYTVNCARCGKHARGSVRDELDF